MVEIEMAYFKKHFSEVIKRAEAGEDIKIVEKGEPKAVLLSIAHYQEKVDLIKSYQKRFPDCFADSQNQQLP